MLFRKHILTLVAAIFICQPTFAQRAGNRSAESKPNVGSVSGRVLDRNGKPLKQPVAVFLCDGKTGWPIVARNNRVLGQANMTAKLSDFRHALTQDGSFKFSKLPAGRYRLVAQSWEGLAGIPTEKTELRKDAPLVIHGNAIVDVQPGIAASPELRSPGDAVVHVKTDPDEGNAFLFPTPKKPIGDYVLGPFAWRDFGTQVLGVTHMHGGKMIVKGLPNNSDIHFCYMNYDNNAGSGGGHCHTGREQIANVNVYATWSNGKYDPPPRLLPLVKHIEREKLSFAKLVNRSEKTREHMLVIELLQQDPEKEYSVGSAGNWRLVDLVAANNYRSLRQAHAARQARRQK